MNLVILDSGHNEYVSGKCNGSFKEWEFNNSMQYKIKPRLEAHGIQVYLTNPNPAKKDEIGLSTRATSANNYWTSKGKPKCIFISLHGNAYSNSSARGTETYHSKNASSNSKSFAKMLNDEVVKTMKSLDSNAKDRGVKSENFTVIYKAAMPSVLVEYGFYSNPDDLKILKNKQDELCEATVKAVCKYFGITYKPKSIAPPVVNKPTKKTETWYRAVCGSFKDKAKAEERIKELTSKGFDGCFIVAFEKEV